VSIAKGGQLSKKDYKAFSDIIRNRLEEYPNISSANELLVRAELKGVAYDMARLFQQDNQNFKIIAFLNACGINHD